MFWYFSLKITIFTSNGLDCMMLNTRDNECTALWHKTGGVVADVEKKRKLLNCSEQYIRIKQIKSALAAVVAEIDPKEATTSKVVG